MPMVASKTTSRLNKAVAASLNATEWRVFDEIIWCFSVIYAMPCIYDNKVPDLRPNAKQRNHQWPAQTKGKPLH